MGTSHQFLCTLPRLVNTERRVHVIDSCDSTDSALLKLEHAVSRLQSFDLLSLLFNFVMEALYNFPRSFLVFDALHEIENISLAVPRVRSYTF